MRRSELQILDSSRHRDRWDERHGYQDRQSSLEKKASQSGQFGSKTSKLTSLRIRRVKCDLSVPSCSKCFSTGRTCDGYSEMPLAFKPEETESETTHDHMEIADRADSYGCDHPGTTISTYESKQWHSKYHGLIWQNLGSFMILPVTGSTQAEAMSFFKDISIKHLNAYRPCEPWRNTLLFFSQTVPSVRHAAIALALVHRNYLDRHSNDGGYESSFLKDRLPGEAPLLHYNRAIQLLLNLEGGDSAQITAVTLLVCYLFTCFDHLAGNDVQALKHVRGGVALSRNIDNATLNNCNYGDAPSSEVHAIICQVTKHIRRLDMQAAMFLVDWTPANVEETFMSHFALIFNSFRSLDQAADHLQILLTQVMRLRNTEQQMSPTGVIPPLPSSLKDIVLGQLETWSSLFENLLQQRSPSKSDFETDPLVSLLRLQHTIAWILLGGYGPGREMDYDNFLPQFQQCVALAGKVAAAHQQYSGSARSTFTPEIGFIPVLYIIGTKCRHPNVRREVLSILRRQLIQEATWDSITTARVVERVIEIEEGAAGEEQMAQYMDQIPVWQRIEALSYINIPRGQSAARLDITYTFCGREGIHMESIIL
ncbi:sugar transporter [Aspergillus bombycis]|uniref:Sugar transporter n=1 Tax=Aspergillus bombycis TaxID=109264 RepID=A0A1F8A9Y5_9EURO|nr:sugar transporter [Aspergillus bombycis]OGM48175.1 sugar transporter [Aspergillus bombycis]